jgi:hypothetical protein
MMTLDEYLKNPMGKTNAVMGQFVREAMRNEYTAKFHNVMVRENGKVTYYVYKDSENNVWYIHVKVPSENVRKFYYDVVFRFFADASIKDSGRDLRKWYVEFFSNDPAWVYTYCYAYSQNNLIIKDLSRLMDKTAMNTPAKEKNPQNLVNYSKIIYFGLLFLQERGLLRTAALGGAEPYSQRILQSRIIPTHKMIMMREEEEKNISHRKKVQVDQATYRKLERIGITDKERDRLVVTTKDATKVKKVGAVNNIKNMKKIKKKR